MPEKFLDPKKPLSTCKETSCDGCDMPGKVVCHFTGKQLARFLLAMLPAFTLGIVLIVLNNPINLISWLGLCVIFFGFVEIRVMCSHCPHYAEPGLKSLKCWANYGSPKKWKYRPGPMSMTEKFFFFLGFFVIVFFPVVLGLRAHGNYWVVGYALALIFAILMLRNYFCNRCMNFACPLNRVDREIRRKFFEKNPVVNEAWKGKR